MNQPRAFTTALGCVDTGIAAGGELRLVATELTAAAEEARRRLDLSPVAAAALGRTMAGAVLLSRRAAKTPARFSIDVRGDGPLGQVLAEATADGGLRGTVANPRVDLAGDPGGKLPVGRAVGSGMLHVWREMELGGTFHSQVQLVSGEIGEDLAHYLAQSEQASSAVLVGVLTRPQGVTAAGGLLVEALPGASEATRSLLERNIERVGGPSRTLDDGGLAALEHAVLDGFERQLVERRELRYHCGCSRERLQQRLILLSRDDREHLFHDSSTISARCSFCGAEYEMRPDELLPT